MKMSIKIMIGFHLYDSQVALFFRLGEHAQPRATIINGKFESFQLFSSPESTVEYVFLDIGARGNLYGRTANPF